MVPILPAAAYDDDASVASLANKRKGGIVWTVDCGFTSKYFWASRSKGAKNY